MTTPALRQLDYVAHILEAIRLVGSYVVGMEREAFLADRKTQQAVILNILVIGEAATQLINTYPDWVARHPEVPWRQIRGMRNRMAHGYFDINLDVVWDTVQQSLPALENDLQAILSAESEPPE
jgi:uncharacterized protein with HEPN domain